MPKLVDTTIRLLGQDPLADAMPLAELYRLAGILDRAGFAFLEVSGGGVFDTAVHRGIESPWERIRALKARTETPLAMAIRGRFLVGSTPVEGDYVRRFVSCAAANGIDVFRLNDPLNDLSNLREAAEAVIAAGREVEGGLVYSSGRSGETEVLLEQARKLPELGASRVLLHDPTGSLQPHRAGELVRELQEATGLPVGIYTQGAAGAALAASLEAARAGADLISGAIYPVALSLYRASAQSLVRALDGLGLPTGVDLDALWRASELVDEYLADEPVAPLAPRIAVRAAEHDLPAALVAALDAHLKANRAADRIDEVLDELRRVRDEAGSPPLAAPIGQILASQALLHVLSASRYTAVVDEMRGLLSGRFGTPPGPIDPAARRAVSLLADGRENELPTPLEIEKLRSQAEGLASSEEELLLLGLFADEAEPLLRAIRGRASGGDSLEAGGVDQSRAERIRELVQLVQESGVGEIEVEDAGMRIAVRRTELRPAASAPGPEAPLALVEPAPAALVPSLAGLVRVESPMVGTFYRASQPGAPPFVEEGAPVAAGQTLCILEAMKLMNEVKAEIDGIVRRIHVENAQPVEFGQLLFELEPVSGHPLDGV